MDEQGFRLEVCENDIEVKDFIERSIEMPIDEFLGSKVGCSNLQKKGITNLNQLIIYTRAELLKKDSRGYGSSRNGWDEKI